MKRQHRIIVLVFTVVVSAFFLINRAVPAISSPPSSDQAEYVWQQPMSVAWSPSFQSQLKQAWQQATDIGVYDYQTTLIQTTHPTERLENVGLSSSTDRMYVEGSVDRPAETMRLKLWGENGSASNGENAIEIKIDRGKALGRVNDSEWEEVDDVSGIFAPDHDPLSYLAAAENVQKHDPEERSGIRLTRYTFDLNGLEFTRYMRRQMEAELQRQGKLPPGMDLEMAGVYVDMEGTGELWLDENELPLRQIIHVKFPPQQGSMEWAEAEISTDFANWGQESSSANRGPGIASALLYGPPGPAANSQSIAAASQSLRHVDLSGGFVLLFGFLILGMVYWNSRRLYGAVTLFVIFSMVVTPVLQSHQVHAFNVEQNEQQAEYEQDRRERQAVREFEAAMNTNDFDPHADPLDTAQTSSQVQEMTHGSSNWASLPLTATTPITATDEDQDGLSNAQEKTIGTDQKNPDTDGDGLKDGNEVFDLGTDPKDADTDGDQILDGIEVVGFEVNTQTWYLDPLNSDSNGDGLTDGAECTFQGTTFDSCGDRDNDQIPDVWDDDNDGDGVPDLVDLDPFTSTAALDNNTLNFKLAHLTLHKPTFVDFQLRPQNPDHLWYTLNVLDWPSDDREGQVRRVYDNTLADFNPDDTSAKSHNGDMRLIPMLQIEIQYNSTPDHTGNLPRRPNAPEIIPTTPVTAWLDTTLTDDYSVSVKKKNDNGDLLAYVPLTLVEDNIGGGPVAFAGRMVYSPANASFDTQSAKLVWVLRGLLDYCDTTGMDTDYDSWCAGTTHWKTVETILHTYEDDWYLTGLSVRQDLGLKTAIVWEDVGDASEQPGYDAHKYYEDKLWLLADYLDQTFIAGQVFTPTGQTAQRDVTIDNLPGKLLTSTISNTIGLPDVFGMQTYTMSHEGELAKIPMTYTKQILDAHFTDGATVKTNPVTLLYLREDTLRTLSLEGGEGVTRNGNTITLNLQETPTQTVASMNWAPFRYKEVGEAGKWEAHPLEDYLSWLETRIEANAPDWSQNDPDGKYKNMPWSDSNVKAGAAVAAHGFYLAFYFGRTGMVQVNETPVPSNYAIRDEQFRQILKTLLGTGAAQSSGTGAKTVILALAERNGKLAARILSSATRTEYQTAVDELTEWGADRRGMIRQAKDFVRPNGRWNKVRLGGALIITTALVALAVLGKTGILPQKTTTIVTSSVHIAYSLSQIIIRVKSLANVAEELGGYAAAIKSLAKSVTRAAKIAAVVGFIVTTAAAIGFFLYSVLSQHMKFGSLAFDDALATVVATVIVAALMLAISAIPVVGELIVLVIGLIDAVIALICNLTGASEHGSSFVKNYICGGITGLLTKAIKFLIYSQTPMVDLQHDNRLNPTNFAPRLTHLDRGYAANNTMNITATIESTLYKHGIPVGIGATYFWQFSDSHVRDSGFKYAFQTNKSDIHAGLSTNGRINAKSWGTKNDHPYGNPIITSPNMPLNVGINQPLNDFYLTEGYAIRVQECVDVIIPACWLRDKKDTQHYDIKDMFKFDIFPITLDEFYQLEGRGQNSVALGWDSRFAVLRDADGDGLRSKLTGGNDPKDDVPDSDGDRLSDFYEVQQGSNPLAKDSDGDGLDDYEEVQYYTDPHKPDTDNDGLMDGDEVFHCNPVTKQCAGGWDFVYAITTSGVSQTLVTSDPLNPDTDGDGITDELEKVYGFNPRVHSDPNIVSIGSRIDDSDGIVAPGQALYYTAKITNELRNRFAYGYFETDFPAAIASAIPPTSYKLGGKDSIILSGSITITNQITRSQQVSLTSRTGSLIIDPQHPVSWTFSTLNTFDTDHKLWHYWPLDEPPGSTNFQSIPPNAIGTCDEKKALCPISGLAGRANQAVQFDGLDDVIQYNAGGGTTFNCSSSDGLCAFSLWFKTTCANCGILSMQGKFSEDVGFPVYLKNGQVCVNHRDQNTADQTNTICTSSSDYSDGRWHHAIFTYDQGDQDFVRLYVDDEKSSSEITDVNWSLTDISLTIGYIGENDLPSGPAFNKYFQGMIDEVKFFQQRIDDSKVITLTNQDPLLNLHFDDKRGSTTFENAGNNDLAPTCDGEQCPDAGANGKIQQALTFDGSYTLTIPHTATLNLNEQFSLGLWVLPIRYLPDLHPLITKDGPDQNDTNYALSIQPNSYKLQFQADHVESGDSCNKSELLKSQGSLVPGVWSHVMVVADGSNITLYINGEPNNTLAYPGDLCLNTNDLLIGNAPSTDRGFAGRMDQVVIYKSALPADRVKALYNYQVAWYDAKADHKIIIDTDEPTTRLDVTSPYVPGRDIIMSIVATDTTSSIAWVEYNVDGSGWHTGKQDNNIWLFTFNEASSLAEGNHTVAVRSTDVVSHISPIATYNVAIDTTPPTVTLTGSDAITRNAQVNLDGTKWTIHLDGSITDSNSGVAHLIVRLLDHKGAIIGIPQTQVWTDSHHITSTTWAVTYPLSFSPSGPYSVQFVSSDRLGNAGSSNLPLSIDGTPPLAEVTYSGDTAGAIHSSGLVPTLTMPIITGTISDIPYPGHMHLHFHLDEITGTRFYDGSRNHQIGTCNGNGCPTLDQAGRVGRAIHFDGHDDRITLTQPITPTRSSHSVAFWARRGQQPPTIEHIVVANDNFSPQFQVGFSPDGHFGCGFWELTLTADTVYTDTAWHHWTCVYDVVSDTHRTLRIYGDGLLLKEEIPPMPPTISSGGLLQLGSAGIAGTYFEGDLDDVLIYERALGADEIYALANSASGGVEQVELALVHRKDSLKLLDLPFEDTVGSTVFRDVSGNQHDATCQADHCPTITCSGKYSAALAFDNSGQYANLPAADSLGIITSSFSVAAWVNVPNFARDQLVLDNDGLGRSDFYLFIEADTGLVGMHFDNQDIMSTLPLTINVWQHVVWRYDQDQGEQAIFINGVRRSPPSSGVAPLVTAHPLTLTLGVQGEHRFEGKMDDFRIYDYALDEVEIAALSGATTRPEMTWVEASLDQAGGAFSTWQYQIPPGVEGPYSIHLRASDRFGHTHTWLNMWQGDIDTLAPRVTEIIRTVTITDYNNLDDQKVPCATPLEKRIQYFDADWYTQMISKTRQQAKAANNPVPNPLGRKIYQLSVTCDLVSPGTGLLLDKVATIDGSYESTIISGSLLYVSSLGGRISIFDISSPSYILPLVAETNAGSIDISDMTLVGQNIYAISYGYWDRDDNLFKQIGLYKYDISNLPAITFTRIMSLPNTSDYSYAEIAVSQGYAYIFDGNSYGTKMLVINLSDPTQAIPTIGVSSSSIGDEGTSVVSDTHLYVDGRNLPPTIIDISVPDSPKVHFSLPGWIEGNDIAVAGEYAYIASHFPEFRVYEITQGYTLTARGSISTSISTGHNIFGLAVDVVGQYAYFMDDRGDDGSRLYTIDITNPDDPVIIASSSPMSNSVPGWSRIASNGEYIYVASHGNLEIYDSRGSLPQIQACDTFGNCATSPDTHTASLTSKSQPSRSATPAVSVFLEAPHVLRHTDPITLYARLMADDLLKDTVIKANGGPIYTQSWSIGEAISYTVIAAPWQPSGEGEHLLTITATDWISNSGAYTTTVIVDTSPPTLTVAQTVYTSSNQAWLEVHLNGLVTDTVGIRRLDVQVEDLAGQSKLDDRATITGNAWRVTWPLNARPNGQSYVLRASARDYGYWYTTVTETILLDLVAPAIPPTITMHYGTGGTLFVPIAALQAGETAADVPSPTLQLAWTASESADVAAYTVEWLREVSETLQLEQSTYHLSTGDLFSTFDAGERQKLWGRLHVYDTYGNTRDELIGPFYVDYSLTPAYISMDENGYPYRNWLDDSCNLLGVDYRIDDHSSDRAALSDPQRIYATWDTSTGLGASEGGLRLAWTGADWDRDGDLFIYLDTQPGGAERLYNPYPGTADDTIVLLPAYQQPPDTVDQMAADYVVWIKGAQDAVLLDWDDGGSQWVTASGEWDYFFNRNNQTTDLYLPFASLGIGDPASTSLALVAVASEEDALRLWATLPNRNHVNSERIAHPLTLQGLHAFALTQRYEWATLDAGVCPSGRLTAGGIQRSTASASGADHLQAAIYATPAGIDYSLFDDNLIATHGDLFAHLTDWEAILNELCQANPDHADCEREASAPQVSGIDFEARSELAHLLAVNHPLVGDGQAISYTIDLYNRGTEASGPITAHVSTWGPVHLVGGTTYADAEGEHDELELVVNNLGPGETTALHFDGLIDLAFDPTNNEGWATLNAVIFDATGDAHHDQLDWLYVDHEIDQAAPDYIEIQSPEGVIGAGLQTISGFVYDRSGVPTLTLEIDTGVIDTVTCLDSTPRNHYWSCNVTLDNVADGDTVTIRVKASDEHGQESGWFEEQLVVDTIPPIVTVDPTTHDNLSDGLVGYDDATLDGDLSDNRLIAGVDVCEVFDGVEVCEQAEMATFSLETFTRTTHVYDDEPASPIVIDASTACGGGSEIVRTFSITDNFVIDDLDVALNLDHPFRNDLQVTLQAPSGMTATLLAFGAEVENLDVRFDDASSVSIFQADDTGAHDTSAPYYENRRQPYPDQLYHFDGQPAQGEWRLTICETYPVEDDGAYNHSQLIMQTDHLPRDTSGMWRYTLSLPYQTDNVTQSITIYGLDAVGNRTTAPIDYTYQVDTRDPAITLDSYPSPLVTWHSVDLSGTISDTNEIQSLELTILDPYQKWANTTLEWNGTTWNYIDLLTETHTLTTTEVITEVTKKHFGIAGDYVFWIEAEDEADNYGIIGPFELTVYEPFKIYMPLLYK